METTINSFITFLKNEKNYSENTCINYRNDLNTFFSYVKIEGLNLENIDYYNIRYYIVSLSSSEYSKSSIKRNLSAVSSYFNYLVDKSIVDVNPVKFVESIKKERYLPEFLFVEEVKKLMVAANESKMPLRDKLIIQLLFLNGFRVSELVNIKVTDIKNNRIKVLGKGSKERYSILNKSLIKTLNLYLEKERSATHDYLLINNSNKPLTDRGVRYILTSISKRSDLDKNVYPHMLRHSFATYFLTHGSDLRTVQTFLGHENISTTQVYTHLSKSHLVNEYKRCAPKRNKGK